MKNTQQWRDRLGYYLVGPNKFFNKALALIEHKRTRYPVEWVFNDSAYGSIDWTVPVQDSLPELYRRRAQQLRDNYDYLVLYFSGGADSTNILHAFIDNDIFLDEILMFMPKSFESQANNTDRSNANFYSEIQYSAFPILNKNKNKIHPNTRIRVQDFSPALIELFQKDNWFEIMPPGTNITITGVGRQAAQVTEPHILDLCYQGKHTAQIMGIDKPQVRYDGTNYYAYFTDLNAMHSTPIDPNQSEIYTNFYHTEFFYWNPSMPEIVVKQAQEIKRSCELNPAAKQMFGQRGLHIDRFKPFLHPVIYPPHIKIDFQTDKPSSQIIRPMDNWFWSTATDRVKNNYLETIAYLEANTESYDMINNSIQNGMNAHNSKFYQL